MSSDPYHMHPARSRALLVGAGCFEAAAGLEDLPSVRAGIEDLQALLVDRDGGGLEPAACRKMIDPRAPSDVADALWTCAEEAQHTLLIYYSGHGIPDPLDGSLLLAVAGTRRQRVHATAVPIEWIRRAMLDSAAEVKVLVLDCCFSGRAIQTMGADSVAAQAVVTGTYVFAAGPANRPAMAPKGERYTAFTGAVLGALRNGGADGDEDVTLDTLFQRVRRTLVGNGLPSPQVERINDAGRLALVRRTARGGAPPVVTRGPVSRAVLVRDAVLAAGLAGAAGGALRTLTDPDDADPWVELLALAGARTLGWAVIVAVVAAILAWRATVPMTPRLAARRGLAAGAAAGLGGALLHGTLDYHLSADTASALDLDVGDVAPWFRVLGLMVTGAIAGGVLGAMLRARDAGLAGGLAGGLVAGLVVFRWRILGHGDAADALTWVLHAAPICGAAVGLALAAARGSPRYRAG